MVEPTGWPPWVIRPRQQLVGPDAGEAAVVVAAAGRGGGATPGVTVDSAGNAVVDARLRPISPSPTRADLLVSGLMDGGEDIAGHTTLVDAPLGKGNVVLFSFDPMYRGETIASYAFVFNAILHFDNLNAGAR